MSSYLFRKGARLTEIIVYVQTVIIGFVLSEFWYLGQAIASVINPYISSTATQAEALAICGATVVVVVAYIFLRDGYLYIRKLCLSYRIDLLLLVIFGISVSVSAGGVGAAEFHEYVAKIPALPLIGLVSAPVVIALIFILRVMMLRPRKGVQAPFFISDQEIDSRDRDLLGFSENAERFALRVLNGGSSDSLVFGVDAPWGIGKSSFINFCSEYWMSNHGNSVIVHRFEPLRYADNDEITDKFVNDLVRTIQKHAFVPSLQTLFSKYTRLTKGKSQFSLFGATFELEPTADTVLDILESLKDILSELNRKVIIVVDDLDRLSWTAVKNILFAIKRSFMLPNVSYVLCYDTENIVSTDKSTEDAERVREFLEKFVNVKISLFLDAAALANYVSKNFEQAVQSNLQLDPRTLDEIKQAIDELVSIFNSADFFLYQNSLGNVRKLKRLINTLMLFEIEKTDFENSDFNKKDLIHLLLIYINYPVIFRKIYDTESNGKSGFFSLVASYEQGSHKFVNSQRYTEFYNTLNESQQFLLGKVFDKNLQEWVRDGKQDKEAAKRSRACFNGGGDSSRNLERYLDLIVKLSKPEKREGYQFYVNMKSEFINGSSLESIFERDEFAYFKGEFARLQFWRVIVNSSYELQPRQAAQLVSYLIHNLPDYSLLERGTVGDNSRVILIYHLLKLLDNVAWMPEQEEHRINSPENIAKIAHWIFGEEEHDGMGVLDTLTLPERGPLGFYDLMMFRLYCSADRGSDLFNLTRALSLHSMPPGPTEGIVTEIAKQEMREISQKVFQIFKSRYISANVNFFADIAALSRDDLAGRYASYISAQIESRELSQMQVLEAIEIKKSNIMGFIVYQLGNTLISSGVGCGYYDEMGNQDSGGIAAALNDYLFNFCFNPEHNEDNYEYFIDYLLINFVHIWDSIKPSYVPKIENFTMVLNKERLKTYWENNKENIRGLELSNKNKSVKTGNYIAYYKEDVEPLYRELDKLLERD